MTEPSQPKDPAPPQKPDQAHAPNGIPEGADEAEPKGTPHSERYQGEKAANS